MLLVGFLTTFCLIEIPTWYAGVKNLVKMLTFSKSSELSSTVTSQQHGIMMSQHKMMKNTYITVVTIFQSCIMFQRRDIANLMQKVA